MALLGKSVGFIPAAVEKKSPCSNDADEQHRGYHYRQLVTADVHNGYDQLWRNVLRSRAIAWWRGDDFFILTPLTVPRELLSTGQAQMQITQNPTQAFHRESPGHLWKFSISASSSAGWRDRRRSYFAALVLRYF